MVIVTAVCKGRGYQTDAGKQSEKYLTHKTSKLKIGLDRHRSIFFTQKVILIEQNYQTRTFIRALRSSRHNFSSWDAKHRWIVHRCRMGIAGISIAGMVARCNSKSCNVK